MRIVKLGTIVKIRTGKLDANAAIDNGKYPFFTCSKDILSINSYAYDCECVLLAGNGDLNVKYYNGKFEAYQRTYILESLDKNQLLVKYLYYFMSCYIEKLRNMSAGGVIKFIKLNYLTNALIPLPNIEDQKQIINELDSIVLSINNNLSQRKKCDELIKSRFIELFGDLEGDICFDDVLRDETKYGYKYDSTFYQTTGEVAIVDQGKSLICGYRSVDGEKQPYKEECIIFGDHTEVFKYINFPFYLGADGTKILRVKIGWDTRFVYEYLRIFYVQIGGYSRHFKFLKEQRFTKPNLKQQKEFSDFVKQIDKSKFIVQKCKCNVKRYIARNFNLYKI